ncbi:hypothetical protein AgCh_005660 [Apium graveolens]
MIDLSEDEASLSITPEFYFGHNNGNVLLTASASFREGRSATRRRVPMRPPSLDAGEFFNLMHCPNLVKIELNRLENAIRVLNCSKRHYLNSHVTVRVAFSMFSSTNATKPDILASH